MVFSGSAVVDKDNTSGFGTRRNPAMVAIYTSAYPDDQEQSLAYSTDRGRTWTKYAGNPVLDNAAREFRDPKVYWYAPERKWVMAVVHGRRAQGPLLQLAGPQALDADERVRPRRRDRRRLGVPGPVPARGRRRPAQAQVGARRQHQPRRHRRRLGGPVLRRRLRRHDASPPTTRAPTRRPPATCSQDFEGADYGAWTTTGTAFGSGPAHGTLPGQQTVSGFEGERLANSFHRLRRLAGAR